MALIGPLEHKGQIHPEAYARLIYVTATPQEAMVFVSFYASAQARQDDPGHPLAQQQFDTQASFEDGIVSVPGYAFLKAQEQFAGWIDG